MGGGGSSKIGGEALRLCLCVCVRVCVVIFVGRGWEDEWLKKLCALHVRDNMWYI